MLVMLSYAVSGALARETAVFDNGDDAPRKVQFTAL